MRNNLCVPIAALFMALLCMATQCRKESIEYKYNFVEKVDLFPSQKSYKVGDTIWIKYTNPGKQLFDKKTNQYVAADTMSIVFQISFNCRYNTPVNPADGFCDYISVNAVNPSIYFGDYGTGFLSGFGCNNNNNYDFTVGIVPRQKGIYSLDLFGVPRMVNSCPNRISGFPLSTIEYRFNLADCNKDIYLEIPPYSRVESPKGYTESKIDSKQAYIVKVE
jgi:hypothetical protein